MPSSSGIFDPIRQAARGILESTVSSKFSATLAKENDIINIFMGLMYFESHFQVDVKGVPLGATGTASKDFFNSSAIQAINSGSDPVAKANIIDANRAMGLCQVLGFYFLRSSSARSGSNLLEQARPDLASSLILAPGVDVGATVVGQSNMDKIITAGLIVLESKYKAAYQSLSGWRIQGDRNNHVFSTKIGAAVGAYLGLGVSDQLGTTPEAYSSSIVGGQAYQIANNPNTIIGQRITQTGGQGPNTNGSGSAPITPAGCA